MRIGIDIDGVLTNIEDFIIDYLSKYCFEEGIKYNIGASSYYISEAFNISEEAGDGFWNKYLEFYSINEKARPFAAEIIKRLKDEGHEIYIITARLLANKDNEAGKKMRKIIKSWLDKNNIIYDKLICSKALKERKDEEILKHKIDLMIEDNPNNIMNLSNIIPVICYNSGYNRECEGEKIIRCYSWYDIYNKIEELK